MKDVFFLIIKSFFTLILTQLATHINLLIDKKINILSPQNTQSGQRALPKKLVCHLSGISFFNALSVLFFYWVINALSVLLMTIRKDSLVLVRILNRALCSFRCLIFDRTRNTCSFGDVRAIK